MSETKKMPLIEMDELTFKLDFLKSSLENVDPNADIEKLYNIYWGLSGILKDMSRQSGKIAHKIRFN